MLKWSVFEMGPGMFLSVGADEEAVRRAEFSREHPPDTGGNALTRQAVKELREYFDGKRTAFSVPFEAEGTQFQCDVWKALTDIPYGETRTYAEVAKAVGRPKAARAVGTANHDNRIPVFIPCHRVLAAGGALGGFACGLDFKEVLLRVEGSLPRPPRQAAATRR
jgi:methylated-DNA-[protein]-cysteine S-methyltransferase